RQREAVEFREHLPDRPAKLPFDDAGDGLEFDRRQAILKLLELEDHVRRHEVGPDAEPLAELDVGGAELLNDLPDPFGARRVVPDRELAAAKPRDQRRRCVEKTLLRRKQPMLDERGRDLLQPARLADLSGNLEHVHGSGARWRGKGNGAVVYVENPDPWFR